MRRESSKGRRYAEMSEKKKAYWDRVWRILGLAVAVGSAFVVFVSIAATITCE